MERAYRRPVTEEELKWKINLVTLATREGDSFDEGIRLALQAILSSPCPTSRSSTRSDPGTLAPTTFTTQPR